MLTVKNAQETILKNIKQLPIAKVDLLDALNLIIAKDIKSNIDVPLMTNSSMDGYALKAIDTLGIDKKGKILKSIGTIQAGKNPNIHIGSGEAIRIMTGSVLPKGADAVIPFEDTDEYSSEINNQYPDRDQIIIYKSIEQFDNIRVAGEDTKKGQVVIKKGTTVNPAHIGLAASIGLSTLPVIKRPRIAILSSGNEIIRPPQKIQPGQVYDSNTFSIAAQILSIGAKPILLKIAKDSFNDIVKKIDQAIECSDMIISTAGVSKGDFDLIKNVLLKKGKMNFWSIKMRPGKPLMFGFVFNATKKKLPQIGLPGNPVSAMVTFELFAKPAILKMMGKNPLSRETIKAKLVDSIYNSDKREVYARVTLHKRKNIFYASTTGAQGSGILQSMSKADGLAKCPSNKKLLKKGEYVEVILLNSI
jgi:molybdopterin molybdotransferase